jgi:hypothetical protein
MGGVLMNMFDPVVLFFNSAPVMAPAFTDVPPGWSADDMYRYYVTAIQTNSMTGLALCESASDTVMVAFPTGIPEPGKDQISIYPNPAEDYIIIRSKMPVTKVDMMSNLGNVIYTGIYNNADQVRLNTTGISQGIYILRLTTISGILFRKVVICR